MALATASAAMPWGFNYYARQIVGPDGNALDVPVFAPLRPTPAFHGDAGPEEQGQLRPGFDPCEPVPDVSKRRALHKQRLSIAHVEANYVGDAEQVPLPLNGGNEQLARRGDEAEPAQVKQGSAGRGQSFDFLVQL